MHKIKLKNLIISFKLELSPQNFHYDVLNPLYSGATYVKTESDLHFHKCTQDCSSPYKFFFLFLSSAQALDLKSQDGSRDRREAENRPPSPSIQHS